MHATRLPILLAAAALALPAVAQEPKQGEASADGAKIDVAGRADKLQAKLQAMKEQEAADKGEKVDPASVQHASSRGYCRFDVSVRPKRLMPTQTGTALLTMILEGDSVLPAPATLTVKAINQAMQVGAPTLQPAPMASVAKAFLGQPAYDNWAVIELPVTMPATVGLGTKVNLALAVEFDLVGGTDGRPLGHFTEQVGVSCEVGTVRDPSVVATPSTGAAADMHETAVGANGKGPAPAAPAAARPTQAAESAPAEAAPLPSMSTPGGDSPLSSGASDGLRELHPQGDGSSMILVLVAGGVVVLVLLIAALARRR